MYYVCQISKFCCVYAFVWIYFLSVCLSVFTIVLKKKLRLVYNDLNAKKKKKEPVCKMNGGTACLNKKR